MERPADEKGAEVARIVVLSGVCAGTSFVLGDVPTVIGRSPESHLMIGDPWISSMHALFERRGDEIWVVDLDSRNGTFVGEDRVAEAAVPDGALVRFGRTEVRLDLRRRAGEVAAADAPRPNGEAQRDTVRSDATMSTRNPLLAREPDTDPYLLGVRPVTVLRMSVDAAGIEALPGVPERLRDALEAAARAALDAGAAVTRLAGVGVLAIFGLTGPAADDAARALGAARAARRAVRGTGGLDLRAAVETGPVLAGNAAGAAGFELTALGAAAERTERLLARALRGEILAGPGAAAAGGLVRLGLLRLGAEDVEVFRDDRV